ncbi:MAG: sortase [Lachnospiraceae bacterium]|nr:sortase [Lachnospiraceae bacterium]
MEEKDRLQMLDMDEGGDPEAVKKLIDDAVKEAQEESANAGAPGAGKDDASKAEADGAKEADTDSIKEEIDAAVREAQEEAKKTLGKEERKKPEEKKRGVVFRKARANTEPLVTPRVLLGAMRYVAIILCILVVVYEGYQIIRNRIQHQEARSEYSEIADSYVVVNGSSSGVKGEGEEEDTETYPNLEIDFAKLREINSDLIAWLYFPALDLSYPIVKERKTDEYLSKTFAGTYNGAGAVFMDHWSSARFNGMSDFVFAHNMNDRSMFGQLTILTIEGNEHLLDEDPYIYIYMEDTVYRYKSFAYYTCPGGGPVYANVGADEKKYDEVLSYIRENNRYETPPEIDFTSRPGLLHLSTCTDWGDARFLVSGAKDHTWYLTEEARLSPAEEYDRLREQYVTVRDAHGPVDGAESKQYPDLEIDFAGLKQANPQVIAWLYMPAIDLSYPVVAETEENEYLNKTFSGKEDPVGAVFMDLMSDPTFGGWNDFVFGHYLQNGAMFGAMNPLMDEAAGQKVIDADPYLYVYTEGRVFRYHVFGYYWAEMGDDPFIQAEKAEHLDRVLAYIKEANLYQGNAGINFDTLETSKRPTMLNLSTCADFGDKRRFIVSSYREGDWKR